MVSVKWISQYNGQGKVMIERIRNIETTVVYDGGKNLFKDILKFKKDKNIQGQSLFQVIVMFCEINQYEEEEIGELLRKDKKFRALLQEDLKMNNEAYFKTDKNTKANNMGDWI